MKTNFDFLTLFGFIRIHNGFTNLLTHGEGMKLSKVVNRLKKSKRMTNRTCTAKSDSNVVPIKEALEWIIIEAETIEMDAESDLEWFNKLPRY